MILSDVCGYFEGIVSGAILQLRAEFHLDCTKQEMVVSSMLMGAVLASFTGGILYVITINVPKVTRIVPFRISSLQGLLCVLSSRGITLRGSYFWRRKTVKEYCCKLFLFCTT